MALIICPECRKEISNRATACNSCGYPISKFVNFNNEKLQHIPPHPLSIEKNEYLSKEQINVIKKDERKDVIKKQAFIILSSVLMVFASFLLLLMIVFLPSEIRTLNYPQTAILSVISITFFWIGALLLVVSAIKKKKDKKSRTLVFTALLFLATAILMIPISRAVNSSILSQSGIDRDLRASEYIQQARMGLLATQTIATELVGVGTVTTQDDLIETINSIIRGDKSTRIGERWHDIINDADIENMSGFFGVTFDGLRVVGIHYYTTDDWIVYQSTNYAEFWAPRDTRGSEGNPRPSLPLP
jgi:hypothetical protein